MSQWATLEARFYGLKREDVDTDATPRGSEGGPAFYEYKEYVLVEGRLRDFDDLDSPGALAWFVDICDLYNPSEAELMVDIDSGPRYRYEWRGGGLRKLRGVLDG